MNLPTVAQPTVRAMEHPAALNPNSFTVLNVSCDEFLPVNMGSGTAWDYSYWGGLQMNASSAASYWHAGIHLRVGARITGLDLTVDPRGQSGGVFARIMRYRATPGGTTTPGSGTAGAEAEVLCETAVATGTGLVTVSSPAISHAVDELNWNYRITWVYLAPNGAMLFNARVGYVNAANTPPVVAIGSPIANQVLASSPVTISGPASDDAGVASVGVAVYRNVAGGQYWNGTGWQSANIAVPATLVLPGAVATAWSYSFAAPPGGVFAVAAVAIDGSGAVGITPYRTFSVADNANPTVTLAVPAANQTFATRPVVLAGSATDNAGVGDVQVAVYRPVGPNGEFWNGTAWQAAYVTVAATMSAPGAASTAWTYSFNPPQSGGLFYVAAIALDTSYRYAVTAFTPFTLPDVVVPTAAITSPASNATTTGTVAITGSATDDVAVALVGVAIYRTSTAQYFTGATWQPGFATVPANMATPGAPTTLWNLSFVPPAPGTYLLAALAIDGNYNYSLSPFITITAV
jgi:hypothetical protein